MSIAISNLFEIANNWSSLGQGNHSKVTETHHEWIRMLVKACLELKTETESLKDEIKSLNEIIETQKRKIAKLSETRGAHKPLFSSLFKVNEKTRGKEELGIIAGMINEFKQTERRKRSFSLCF